MQMEPCCIAALAGGCEAGLFSTLSGNRPEPAGQAGPVTGLTPHNARTRCHRSPARSDCGCSRPAQACRLRHAGTGLPVASVVSRRAGVVLAPVGIMLLVAAVVIESPGNFARHLRDIVLSRAGCSWPVLLVWIGLAATWSPFRDTGWTSAQYRLLPPLAGLSAPPPCHRACARRTST